MLCNGYITMGDDAPYNGDIDGGRSHLLEDIMGGDITGEGFMPFVSNIAGGDNASSMVILMGGDVICWKMLQGEMTHCATATL